MSDVSGVSGMAIFRAIVRGERDPQRLAELKNERIQASKAELARSLEGDWREEQLFVLEQSLQLYDTYLEKIAECDRRVERHLKQMEAKVDVEAHPLPAPLS